MEKKPNVGVGAPLVGRRRELRTLSEALDQAVQYETPQVVLVVGGQGVGKTRLLEHWVEQIREDWLQVRAYRCAASDGGASYNLFASLLRTRFNLPEAGELLEAFRVQVEEVLEDRRLAEFLHFLGSFVGLTVPDSPFIRALDEAPQQHDEIARTVLRRFLEMDAQRSALLLVLEDLHLADDDSLSLFRELAESLEGSPVVLLATCRPELFVREPDFCELEAELTRVDLHPLSGAESDQLLRELLSRVSSLPDDLVEEAAEMTGGNPLFIEALVRMLIANGTIQARDDVWTIDADLAEDFELPVSVEEAVHARISSLSAPERDVLEKAATLGSVFWKEALICFSRLEREVDDKGDLWLADVEHQTIQAILERLMERDFILSLPDSSIPGATEFAFKHNMERELISKMISHDRMAQYHLFAAQWLETRLRDRSEAQLEYVGNHYEQGGNRRRAAFFYVHAGDKARARYANEQAAVYYRRGIGLLGLDDVVAKIEALHNLGDVCSVLGHHDEALEHFSEMLHNAWLLDNMSKGGAAHRRIGRIHRTLGDYDRARSHLQSAMRLFEDAGDTRGVAATLDDVGQMAWLRGEYQRALDFHRRALAIKREIGNPRSIAVALNNIGSVHQNSGAFREAQDCFVEALEIRREVGDQIGVVEGLLNLGGVFRAQSDYSKAFELWTEALQQARQIGDRLNEAYLLINIGEALIQLGRPRDASQRLDEALALARELGDRRLRVESLRILAEVKLATGDLEEAERQAELAYETSEELGLRPETGAALRTLAEVVAAQEIDDERKQRATLLYDQAIELFTDLGNDLEIARTFASFADYHDRCGNWEDADHFRSSADDIFNRLKGSGSAAGGAGR
jgi:tetratricopeptide (TPR) repeat protein